MRRPAILAILACAVALGACHPAAKTDTNAADAGAAFLAKKGKEKGVVTLPDGLEYKILTSGPADGLRPHPNDEIKFHYELRSIDGKVIQSSFENGAPAEGALKNLIPGWIEALQLMRPGDTWELYVPAKLAYGDQDKGDIPPNSTLIFKIELLGVLPDASNVGAG
jgi:FKBP-type peptidyl-prolyl cis-trans isomerase FklB